MKVGDLVVATRGHGYDHLVDEKQVGEIVGIFDPDRELVYDVKWPWFEVSFYHRAEEVELAHDLESLPLTVGTSVVTFHRNDGEVTVTVTKMIVTVAGHEARPLTGIEVNRLATLLHNADRIDAAEFHGEETELGVDGIEGDMP